MYFAFDVSPFYDEGLVGLVIMDALTDIYFILDLGLNFFTGYIDKRGVKILKLKHDHSTAGSPIWVHYLRTWFILDLIASLPLQYFIDNNNDDVRTMKMIRMFRIIRLFKMLRIFRIFRVLARQRDNFEWMHTLAPYGVFAKQFAYIFVLVHTMCCLWFLVGKSNETLGVDSNGGVCNPSDFGDCESITWNGWAYGDDIRGMKVIRLYLTSFYQIWIFIFSGAYDPKTINMSEQLFCIFAAAVGALVFGLVLAKVSETFQHMNPTKDEIKKNEKTLDAYMQEQKMQHSVRRKFRYYMEHSCAMNKVFGDFEHEFILSLPHYLRTIYIQQCMSVNFREFKELKNVLFGNPKGLLDLYFALRPLYPEQNEVLVERGRISLTYYLVTKGDLIKSWWSAKAMHSDKNDKKELVTNGHTIKKNAKK